MEDLVEPSERLVCQALAAMKSLRMDRFLSKTERIANREARNAIVSGHIRVNDEICRDPSRKVSRFDRVEAEERVLQPGLERLLIMLHKPLGVLSATTDPVHPTVIDLIDHPAKATLHLAGRLDRYSTGLVLLTNDGDWSNHLTRPQTKLKKVYLVETATPIPEGAVERFAAGFWFAHEGIRTQPAKLELLGPTTARVTLTEGRWHQIKRMFYRLDETRLKALHRERIGPFLLPDDLPPGMWRVIDGQPGASILRTR